MIPRAETQVVRVGDKYVFIRNHLTGSDVSLLSIKLAVGKMYRYQAHLSLIFRTCCSDFVNKRKFVSYPVQIPGRHFCTYLKKILGVFKLLGQQSIFTRLKFCFLYLVHEQHFLLLLNISEESTQHRPTYTSLGDFSYT